MAISRDKWKFFFALTKQLISTNIHKPLNFQATSNGMPKMDEYLFNFSRYSAFQLSFFLLATLISINAFFHQTLWKSKQTNQEPEILVLISEEIVSGLACVKVSICLTM